MKKLFTLLLAIGIFMGTTLTLDAQSPRICVVEEATQASCPPCATLNPALLATMEANTDKAIFIAYQVWWPGYDAMYLDNTTEVDWRIINNYYTSITGAPNIIMQGNSGAQSTSYVTQQRIDDIYAETSEFDIMMDASVVNGMLEVSGTVTATSAVTTGDLRLRLILTEDVIYNEDLIQIGTNGETEFHHVFKKFIPGVEGLMMSNDWAVNDQFTFNETFDLGTLNIYHYDGLEVVAMAQDDNSKYIHQAYKVHDVPITVSTDVNATAHEITNLPPAICSGEQTITPHVKIQNSGNNNLTAVDIVYDVNGGTPQTVNWTGDLNTLASETVALDPITFMATGTDEISVSLESPNGVADEDTSDNGSSESIAAAPSVGNMITITINTDCWPEETSWELRDGAAAVVASGGTYAGQAETEIIEEVTLPDALDCYEFVFMDSYGDGLNGSQWSSCDTDGSVVVTDSVGGVVWDYDGSYGFSEEITPFEAMAPLGVVENVLNTDFSIAPNPVSNTATIKFTLVENEETMVKVLNVTGQEVMVKNFGLLTSGNYQEELSFDNLNPGVYFVNLISGNNTGLKKVTVVR